MFSGLEITRLAPLFHTVPSNTRSQDKTPSDYTMPPWRPCTAAVASQNSQGITKLQRLTMHQTQTTPCALRGWVDKSAHLSSKLLLWRRRISSNLVPPLRPLPSLSDAEWGGVGRRGGAGGQEDRRGRERRAEWFFCRYLKD